MSIQILDLDAFAPLAAGCARLVFAHPHDPDLLVKVVRPEGHDVQRARRRNRPSVIRFGALAGWNRELSEYIRVLDRIGRIPDFIAPYHGFCQTTVGVGLIVGRVTDGAGGLAPTLRRAMRNGARRDDLAGALDDFIENMRLAGAVASDLGPSNIVVSAEASGPRLILVDGLGDRVMIPVRRFSSIAYRQWLHRKHVELTALLNADS